MAKQGKGSAYEREICKLISRWWTYEKRDDIFWRTSNSGGRATVRAKQNRWTYGQHGDITATHPMGESLVKLVSIEIKRGYGDARPSDSIDQASRKDRTNPKVMKRNDTTYEKHLKQAVRQAEEAGAPYWWLINKRDYKIPMISFPLSFFTMLVECESVIWAVRPMLTLVTLEGLEVVVCPFHAFLEAVDPVELKEVAEKLDARKVIKLKKKTKKKIRKVIKLKRSA